MRKHSGGQTILQNVLPMTALVLGIHLVFAKFRASPTIATT